MPTLDERIEAANALTGYTPGPWSRIGWAPCGIYGPGDLPNAQRIARMDERLEHDDCARLIAAAPDLHRLALDLAAERERMREVVSRWCDDAGNAVIAGLNLSVSEEQFLLSAIERLRALASEPRA